VKTNIIFLGLLVVFCFSGVLYGSNWDIYSDAVIEDGDDYWTVRVFDSPPDHTTVDMTGGTANGILTYNASTLNISGGFTEITSLNESTINMDGGLVYTLAAWETSTVNVSGGTLNYLHAWGTSTTNVDGNVNIISLNAREFSMVNMTGGNVTDHISAFENGTVHLSGGIILDSLSAGDSGMINVYGYDLGKSSSGGTYGDGYVWGKWNNDVAFNIDFYGSGSYSRVILIPEPSSVFLLFTGGILLKRRKR